MVINTGKSPVDFLTPSYSCEVLGTIFQARMRDIVGDGNPESSLR